MKLPLLREVSSIFRLLPRGARRKYILVAILQSGLGLVDLLGVALMGLIGALSINGVQSKPVEGRISTVLNTLQLSNLSFQNQIAALCAIVVSLFTFRTVITIRLSRKILFFLGNKAADISEDLVSKLLARKFIGLNNSNSHDVQYAIGPGVSALSLGVLGISSTVISDSSILLIIGFGVMLFDPLTAISSLLLFVLISVALYFVMHKKARSLGTKIGIANVQTNRLITQVMHGFREIYTRDRREFYRNEIENLRRNYSADFAEQTFLPNISKYTIELSVVFGAVFIAAIQFLSRDAAHAAAGLGLFFAAGSRIAPALLRIQQSIIQIQGNLGAAAPTLAMIKELSASPRLESMNFKEHTNSSEAFIPKLLLKEVTFSYDSSSTFSVHGLNLEVASGSFIAIVGKSGSGKSTLLDLALGILEPQSGVVTISDLPPAVAINRFPGAIAYVPQYVSMIEGSVRDNVTLGFPQGYWSDEVICESLGRAKILETINAFPQGLDTQIGELGSGLSGGQKQRIGIARALLTNPRLIFLDEATSSLDSETESEVTQALLDLPSGTTVVVIAHRLSTIKEADTVYYMDKGKIIDYGKFDELKLKNSEFRDQAFKMGL